MLQICLLPLEHEVAANMPPSHLDYSIGLRLRLLLFLDACPHEGDNNHSIHAQQRCGASEHPSPGAMQHVACIPGLLHPLPIQQGKHPIRTPIASVENFVGQGRASLNQDFPLSTRLLQRCLQPLPLLLCCRPPSNLRVFDAVLNEPFDHVFADLVG